MEPKGSSPHSHVPATCPYPEPARSSPYPHIPLPEDVLILSSHLCLDLFHMVSFTLVSPPKSCICLPHTCYMTHLSHSSQFYHPNNIGWRVRINKLLIMYFLHSPVTLTLLGQNILLDTLFSSTLSTSIQVSCPYKMTGKIIVIMYCIMYQL